MSDRRDAIDLATILERQAVDLADRPFLRMDEGELGFGEFNSLANRVADGLRSHGVRAGDMVSVMLPNCREFMLTWFALLKLAAVEAPVNVAFRGSVLAHVLALTEARVLIVDDAHIEAIGEVVDRLPSVQTLIVRGDASATAARLPELDVQPWVALLGEDRGDPPRRVDERALAMLMFTSGTTGPSKACMLSHRYVRRHAEVMIENLRLETTDRLYSPFPLFHADAAVFTVVPALVLGGVAAIGRRFSASRFWKEVRDFEATVFDFMGATLTILWKQAPRSDEADNPVRLAWGAPMPEFRPRFEERFGLKLIEVYGLTDAGLVAYEPLNAPHHEGSCGRPASPFEISILDQHGFPLPAGEVGEIAIRPGEPSVVMDGYYRMPDATLSVFRDQWLHTGDLGSMDDEGYLYFVERAKDSIRRRGENISAFEIEEVLEGHPDILEAAAVGVPSELTEEDVKVWVVLRSSARLSPEELIAFCEDRMAYFMVPRYVEFVDALPRTPTEKVEKYVLREAGFTQSTWDREKGSMASRPQGQR